MVDIYRDQAVGVLGEDPSGNWAMTKVTLRPRSASAVRGRPAPEELRQLQEARPSQLLHRQLGQDRGGRGAAVGHAAPGRGGRSSGLGGRCPAATRVEDLPQTSISSAIRLGPRPDHFARCPEIVRDRDKLRAWDSPAELAAAALAWRNACQRSGSSSDCGMMPGCTPRLPRGAIRTGNGVAAHMQCDVRVMRGYSFFSGRGLGVGDGEDRVVREGRDPPASRIRRRRCRRRFS